MDRNEGPAPLADGAQPSLSARRAWIEIEGPAPLADGAQPSLSARRAWIEMPFLGRKNRRELVALRKESVDRNIFLTLTVRNVPSRSPQGERG